MEGLGSAAGTALPLVFGSALLRRACICSERAVTSLSEPCALPNIGFPNSMTKLCATQQAFSSLPNAGSVLPCEAASNGSGRALAAKGRTAHAEVAQHFDELARPCVGLTAWDVRVFECRLFKAR